MGDEVQLPLVTTATGIKDLSFNGEESARTFLADLMTDIRKTLTSATLTENDRICLKQSCVQIPAAFKELAKQFEPTRVEDSERVRVLYISLHQLMLGSFYAGAVCAISDSARDYVKKPFGEGGHNTGKKRGEQLKLDANTKWRDEAQEIWQVKRANKGIRKVSQDRLAKEIAKRIPSAPGHRQIVNYISSLDRQLKIAGQAASPDHVMRLQGVGSRKRPVQL